MGDHARFKVIAHKLYDKYLRESSPLEINISSEQRARHRRYDEMDYMTLQPKDWIRLYDDVLGQLEAYIVQSYKRMILKMDKVEGAEWGEPVRTYPLDMTSGECCDVIS